MIILILCILANVSLGLLFKVFPKYEIRNLPTIVINYLSSILVGSLIAGKFIISTSIVHSLGIWYIVALSLLFIIGFNILGKAFQIAGISLTTIIQKMSILLSAVYALLIYHDPIGFQKGVGLLFAVFAIAFVYYIPKEDRAKVKENWQLLIYPFLAFLLSGLIEIILLIVGKEGLTTDSISFVSHSFALASAIGFIVMLFTLRPLIKPREIVAGIILGIPNFLTIYLLIYLVESGWQGSVLFPLNNIGILVLSVLAGLLLYNEKLDKYKLIGLALAVISIVLIGMELI